MSDTCDKPGCAGGHQPGRCTGHRSDGSGRACRKWPMHDLPTCRAHGSASPQAKAAAQRRRQLREQSKEVARLGLAVATTPTAALSDALNRSYGDVLVTAAKVQLLDADGWKQRDASGKYERPSVWLELYWQSLDRYSRIADRCTALGIEAAAVSVVQRQGAEVVQLLYQVLSALGHDPAAPDVVEVVTREIRVLEGGEAA